jgi:cell division protease FtsH
MSPLGPVNYGPDQDQMTWGRGMTETRLSEAMLSKIDSEVEKILDEGYKKALSILKKNKAKLDKVAEVLIKKETIEGEEFDELMGGKKLYLANNASA